MSESSDSWHLRAASSQAAVEILRAAAVPGYVFGPSAGWVSFVFPRGSRPGLEDFVGRVVIANTGLLVRYTYAEDHGCSALVYEGANGAAAIAVSFESDERGHFDRATFIELGLLTADDADDIERWTADPQRDRGLYVVASRLQLPRHELFGYEQERDAAFVTHDRIEVGADGSARHAEDARGHVEEREREEESGALLAMTRALVQELMQSSRLVLVSGSDPVELAKDLAATLGEQEADDDEADVIFRSLTHHELVDGHVADPTSIRAILSRHRAAR